MELTHKYTLKEITVRKASVGGSRTVFSNFASQTISGNTVKISFDSSGAFRYGINIPNATINGIVQERQTTLLQGGHHELTVVNPLVQDGFDAFSMLFVDETVMDILDPMTIGAEHSYGTVDYNHTIQQLIGYPPLPPQQWVISSDRPFIPIWVDTETDNYGLEQLFPNDYEVISYLVEKAQTEIMVELPERYIQTEEMNITEMLGDEPQNVKAVGFVVNF